MTASTTPAAGADAGTSEFPECILEAVAGSVVDTLSMILGVAPETGPATRDTTGDCVIGVMSFVGDPDWTLMIGLPRDTAVSLAVKFAGFEIEFDSADMGDVVGELANVLAGDVRARVEDCGHPCQMGLPSVLRGHEVEVVPNGGDTSTASMTFSCEDGDFWIELAAGCAE